MNSLIDAKGFDKEAFIRVHNSGEQITSIRFNPAKINGERSKVKGEKSNELEAITADSRLTEGSLDIKRILLT